jgi:hypothetical protein
MATVRVRIVILTVWITLSLCPFNRMAHTANKHHPKLRHADLEELRKKIFLRLIYLSFWWLRFSIGTSFWFHLHEIIPPCIVGFVLPQKTS